jgi:hypothetical protein
MSQSPPTGPQDDGPPEIRLVVIAANNLGEIAERPDRSTGEIIQAIDALGRALTRLKAYLRALEP